MTGMINTSEKSYAGSAFAYTDFDTLSTLKL